MMASFFRLLINISHFKSTNNAGVLYHVVSNGQDDDIESAAGELQQAEDGGSRPSIFSIEPCTRYEDYPYNSSQGPMLMTGNIGRRSRTPVPSSEAIIAIVTMGSTIMVGLMAVNSPGHVNNGGDYAFLDGHPIFSGSFVVIGAATFYFMVIGAMICRLRPNIARMLNLVALVLAALAVTLLLWAFLPETLKWVPWIFFAITILAALLVQLYEWYSWATARRQAQWGSKISWARQCHDDDDDDGYGLPTRTPSNNGSTVIFRNSSSRHIPLTPPSTFSRLRRARSASL